MRKHALIVDDEPETCELIRKVLASAGMETTTLTRSVEAPDLLNDGMFDVVFLDLHMAYPDGLEIARQMRGSKANRMTPIILISDDQRASALSIGFEAGATFFLYKPIDKDRLAKLIRATQGAKEQERRRTRRIPLQAKVRVRFGAGEMDGETIDISPTGVLVKASRTIPPGSPVQIRMYLSSRMRPVVSLGSVVRIADGNRMGIHLGGMTAGESERLEEFLLPLILSEVG